MRAQKIRSSIMARSGRRKPRPERGFLRSLSLLLLFAEVLMAGAARLSGSADLRLDGGLVTALADLGQLRSFLFEVLRGLLEFVVILPDGGQGSGLHALLVLGAFGEAVPGHLGERRQKLRVSHHGVLVVRCLALRHRGERAE